MGKLQQLLHDPAAVQRMAVRFALRRMRTWRAAHTPVPATPQLAQAALEAVYPDNRGGYMANNELVISCDLHIIVPVYCVERYVAQCIDSILGQQTRFTYKVTVVNDGSPDGSREILRRYETDPHVEVIDQENRGFSGARNRGLQRIWGRYVTFVDSDDMLPPNAIETLMSEAERTDADVVQGMFDHIVRGRVVRGNRKPGLRGFAWGKVIRAQLLQHIQFPPGYLFEDTLMAFAVFPQTARTSCIPNVVYHYRLHSQSISATYAGKPKALDTLYVTRALLTDRQRAGLDYSARIYDTFLRQMRINHERTLTVRGGRLCPAVFVETARLRDQYFRDMRTTDPALQASEAALLRGDYRAYLRAVS